MPYWIFHFFSLHFDRFRFVQFCFVWFRFGFFVTFRFALYRYPILTGVILQWGDLTWTWSHFDNLIAAIQIHEIVFIDGQSCLQRLSELLFVDSPRCGCAIFISTLSSKPRYHWTLHEVIILLSCGTVALMVLGQFSDICRP
jgi:hypothetical protein